MSNAKAARICFEGGSTPAVFLPSETITIRLECDLPGAALAEFRLLNYRDAEVFSFQKPLPDGIAEWGSTLLLVGEQHIGDPPSTATVVQFRDASGGDVLTTRRGMMKRKMQGQRSGLTFGLYGVFRACLTLKDSAGNLLAEEESTFARIPDVRLNSPRPDSPFGIGAYYVVRFEPEGLAVASRIQQRMGAAWDRDEFLWDLIEPEQGKWDWSRADRSVKAARENNIRILGLLDYWGKWAKPFTDEGYAAYANYVMRMVERYKPGGELARQEGWTDGYGISDWEIWNEPATFWSGSGEQFGRLLSEANRAAKTADPNCRVYFSEAGRAFNQGVLQVAGVEAFDGVTPHYYCPPRSPEEGEMDIQMRNTPEIFREIGVTGKPFWVSEFGWPSTMDPQEMRNQANYLVRSHVYGLAAGLDKFFWYNFVNDTPDKNARHYGLINREDWTPRFGFGAYAAMVHFLEGAQFHRKVELVGPAKIHVFRKPNESVAVLWSSGAEGMLRIASERVKALRAFDVMGNLEPIVTLPVAEKRAEKENTEVRASGSASAYARLHADPIYLVGKSMTAEDLASLLEGGVVEGISSAEVRVLPLIGALASKPPVRVEIRNVGREVLQGAVTLQAPEGWAPARAEKPTGPIAPGESAVVQVKFDHQPLRNDNRYPFSVTFADSRGNEAVGEARLAEHIAVRGTPTIDGDASDWAGVPRVALDTPDRAVGLVPYMDWNLSTEFALRWDDANLYFLGRVRDNVFDQSHTGSIVWEGDSFQVAFDTRVERVHPPREGVPGLYLFGFSHTSKGDEGWLWPTPSRRTEESPRDVRFAFTNPEKDVYIYEAAIPRDRLRPLEWKPGAEFGFSLLLNDNDGGGRRGWLELTPGIGTGFDPRYFLRWTLVGDHAAPRT